MPPEKSSQQSSDGGREALTLMIRGAKGVGGFGGDPWVSSAGQPGQSAGADAYRALLMLRDRSSLV